MSTIEHTSAMAETQPAEVRNPAKVSLLRSCITLYQLTLRQYVHGRRWIALALLFLLPAGMALLIRTTPAEVPSRFVEFMLAWILIPQALLPVAALLYASGIIQDEQEDQTITYLLMRPIPKWMIYLVKMLATWTTIVFLVVLLSVVTYSAVYMKTGAPPAEYWTRSAKAAAILSLAGIAYCSLFGAIGLITKRILLIGILYTAVVEGVFASMPLSLRTGTIIYYVRLLAYRTLDFKIKGPLGTERDVAARPWNLDIAADPKLAEHPQVAGCIWTLVIASIVCLIVAAWLCSRREFHVKTPEPE